MKSTTLMIAGILWLAGLHAQDDPCSNEYRAAAGNWKPVTTANLMPRNDPHSGQPFLEAIHQILKPYKPFSLKLQPHFSMTPRHDNNPLNIFTYSILAYEIYCNDGKLTDATLTPTTLLIQFNYFDETPLYDTSADNMQTGFFHLSHGLPVEIKPGIWQFPDDGEPAGYSRGKNSKLWLLTFDGQLPWTYVTRREFLARRRQNLERMLAERNQTLKEQLEKANREKTDKEEQFRNDPSRLAKYIENDYNPYVEQQRAYHEKSGAELRQSISRIEDELQEPGMNSPAIVKKDPNSLYDYNFLDRAEPGAEILTKPNPGYINKKLSPSIPQMISVELTYNEASEVYTRFADEILPYIDLDFLKSCIGKTAPGVPTAKR